MSRSVAICALFFIYNPAHSAKVYYRDVETQEGTVRGYLAEDGYYMAYLGVPYAAPPIGENRFKAPLPPLPWDGIYEAKRTIRCPQNGIGEEDCLILNIFTPVNDQNDALPVLVYIHGGSFLLGSAQSNGVEPLIKEKIIVVTINYRLGALGFLCLGIKEAPGNAGLKDQVAALKWVQDNIVNFGGDLTRVTIYGMSAGGASVDLHVLSEMSRGLFKKAIVESGSATSVWAIDADPIATATIVADLVDLPANIDKMYALLDYYLQVPAHVLSKINYDYYNNLTDGTFGFVPCIERDLCNQCCADAFITESPYKTLTKEYYDKVPMMFFFASLEGLFLRSEEYYTHNYKQRMELNFADFVPADLNFDNEDVKDEVANYIRYFYFGNKTVEHNNVIQYLNYFGDNLVLQGLLKSVEINSRQGNHVYLLEFSYKGNMGSYEEFYENFTVAGHGDVIKHAIINKPILNNNDKVTVERVSKLIANFVKFGDPTPKPSDLLPTVWPRVNPTNVMCLRLNIDFDVVEKPYWERKNFWDRLHAVFRRKLKPVDPYTVL